MIGWEKDKKWSDKFIEHIKPILGTHLIGPAPVREDQERNTDLIVLKMEAVRIACRIRKAEYRQNYGGQFTIRASRPRNNKTELAKVIDGFGDYFFYAFANEYETGLSQWLLGDLKVFRNWFLDQLLAQLQKPGNKLWDDRRNHDGSSTFVSFNIADLPKEFVVASENLVSYQSSLLSS